MSGTGIFRVVLISDPAIDLSRSDSPRYMRDRDESALVFHDGMKPAVFHCRPLTIQERREARNKATVGDRYEAAFVRGLVSVEGLLRPDGRRVEFTNPEDGSGKSKPIPDSVLESYFDEAAIQEVGMVIWFKSFLAPTSQGYWPLPDISLHAAMGRESRRAAQTSVSSSLETSSVSHVAQSVPTTSEGDKS